MPKRIRTSALLQASRTLVGIFTLAFTCSLPLHGQAVLSSNTLVSFTPQQKNVLRALSEFDHLPDGPWQYHAGDVSHGEDPSLNTQSWPVAKWPMDTAEGAVWFRRWITIPASIHGYSLKGATISFQFGAFAHGGIQEIVYFDGRRVALGESLEPILLVQDPKPGERILVAVKLLHSSGPKHVTAATLPITPAAGRPVPSVIRDECTSARSLLPMLVSDEHMVDADQKVVDKAVAEIDVSALQNSDNAAFDSSLWRAQQKLEGLRPTLRKATMLLVGQSHIDAAWLWPWTDTVDAVHRTFFTTLQLMDEYPSFRYTQSAMQYYAWMEEKYPDLFAQIKQRIRDGRWEVVGGMWVEPDFNMPSGETTVRELLLGKEYAKKHLGVDVTVGWNPDSFGYSWQLPQIYRKVGISSFVTQKMAWNDTNQLPLKLFWWESPDGSKVLTYFANAQNADFQVVPVVADLKAMHQYAPGVPFAMENFGVGDHGGGVTRSMLDAAAHWTSSQAVFPATSMSSAGAFFAEAQKLVESPAQAWNYHTLAAGQTALPQPASGHIEIPIWDDELYLEFHRGTYTSQAKHKAHMRQSEEELLNAEKLSSVAWLDGVRYPADSLAEAWKKATFNGFHDLAAGSGTANIYVDADRDFALIRRVTDEARHNAMDDIAAHADTLGKGTPVLVFNTLAWKRTAPVELTVQLDPRENLAEGIRLIDPKGHDLPVQVLSIDAPTGRVHLIARVEVPSMGYVVLHALAGKPEVHSSLSAHGMTLENALLRVVVDPQNGCITHLLDKQTGFDSIAPRGCGDQLQTFHDNPKRYDAWNIDASALTTMVPITKADSVQLVEKGPLRATIRIKRHWDSSTFTQDIILYDGSDQVEIGNDFDWHETHVLLKAAFPLAASSGEATYEIPYGTINRPTTRNNPVEKAKYEVPALRWADLGDGKHGFTLLNQSKYGYDARGNVLRLTLLRSPVYPDPNADRGRQQFQFALYPHSGTWQTAMSMRHGWQYNYPLLASTPTSHYGPLGAERSFVQVDDDAVVLTAIKHSEEGNGLVFRLYDWTGRESHGTLEVPGAPVAATEANLLEHKTPGEGKSLKMSGRMIEFDAAPYEIKTILVKYPGISH